MDDTKQMFQKIINGQSAMKSELLTKISKLDVKIDNLDKKIDGVELRLTKRMDKIGLQVAGLEDVTPTIDEFDDHEERIKKIEKVIASV